MPLPPDELWCRPSVLGAGGRGRSVRRRELTMGRCGSEDAYIFTSRRCPVPQMQRRSSSGSGVETEG